MIIARNDFLLWKSCCCQSFYSGHNQIMLLRCVIMKLECLERFQFHAFNACINSSSVDCHVRFWVQIQENVQNDLRNFFPLCLWFFFCFVFSTFDVPNGYFLMFWFITMILRNVSMNVSFWSATHLFFIQVENVCRHSIITLN